MDYEYIVEVRDYLKNIVLFEDRSDDSNTAYQLYRRLEDEYRDVDTVTVTLIEP